MLRKIFKNLKKKTNHKTLVEIVFSGVSHVLILWQSSPEHHTKQVIQEQEAITNRCLRQAPNTHAVPDFWILTFGLCSFCWLPLSLPPLWYFSIDFGSACSWGLSSPCALAQVSHTGPEDSTVTRPKLNVTAQRKEQQLQERKETKIGRLWGQKEEERCKAQRPLPRLSHTEVTSRHDKSWVGPARREISNTLCPCNKYIPLRETQGSCQSTAWPI